MPTSLSVFFWKLELVLAMQRPEILEPEPRSGKLICSKGEPLNVRVFVLRVSLNINLERGSQLAQGQMSTHSIQSMYWKKTSEHVVATSLFSVVFCSPAKSLTFSGLMENSE